MCSLNSASIELKKTQIIAEHSQVMEDGRLNWGAKWDFPMSLFPNLLMGLCHHMTETMNRHCCRQYLFPESR